MHDRCARGSPSIREKVHKRAMFENSVPCQKSRSSSRVCGTTLNLLTLPMDGVPKLAFRTVVPKSKQTTSEEQRRQREKQAWTEEECHVRVTNQVAEVTKPFDSVSKMCVVTVTSQRDTVENRWTGTTTQFGREFGVYVLPRRRDVCGSNGVHCKFCLGDGFHPSSCSAPAETNHMAGSAREPTGHSMCISDTWRQGIQWSPSPQLFVLVRSGWTHDGHWIRQRAMGTHFKYCDHQYVSSGCVRRSAFQAVASAVKPTREVSSVASGSNALHGRPCPFDRCCDDDIACGPGR